MATSRRKNKSVITKTGLSLETCWCRKCMQFKRTDDFLDATDTYLDSNGKMSVCRDCCNEIYSKFFRSEHSMEKSLLKICRLLNIKYDENAISATHAHLNTMHENGKSTENIFGIYKGKLVSVQNTRISDKKFQQDMTFTEPTLNSVINEIPDSSEEIVDLKQFWGENFAYEDYIFLENELAEWKKTHKADTKAEVTLLKELCYKSLEIRKARIMEKSTASLVKELQELMKTASVDPAKTSQAGSGKAQDTFSSFIQIIEQNEPAEYYKDKELFKDFDNLDFYFRKYITRPLKNFITQSRDFNVETEDEEEEFEFTGEVSDNADFTPPV